jgi:uncharacterized protein YecE (DUF72 family)
MTENLFIGPAGWSYPDWDGVVYPSRKNTSFDPLEFIASYFNLVEINSTFYRIPEPSVTRRWTKRVERNSSFRFTAKLHRNFTHAKGNLSQADMNAFLRAVAPMHQEEKLGFVLIQFPWSFRNGADSKSRIKQLASALAPLPVAVEVRHGSWEGADTRAFFEENGITLCCIDQPIIGQSLTPRTHHAGPSGAYFRLHGRNAAKWFGKDTSRDERYDYLYSLEELSNWSKKISTAAASKKPVFAVTNNHFRGQAVANAFELIYMLTGKKVSLPATVAAAFPELKKIAGPDDGRTAPIVQPGAQGDLFETDSAPQNKEQE